jgi:hypothetical protein
MPSLKPRHKARQKASSSGTQNRQYLSHQGNMFLLFGQDAPSD